MLPAHLTETLNNLGDAAGALAEEVRADKEQRAIDSAELVARQRKQNRRVMALLVTVAILVAALTLMAVSNRLLNNQNRSIVERIESCTTVGGECYEQSSRRTGEAAASIIRAGIYTQRCLTENPRATDAEIEACVFNRMKTPAGAPR
jgi:hypothetical protein